MLKCSYIILIYNNESTIPKLIDSLEKINGNFRKEFIFIDDGSTDQSLQMLKERANNLPRCTIVTQDHLGPAVSVNKAFGLVTGDYIHFLQGDEVIHPEATTALIDACLKFGTNVAFGLKKSNIPLANTLNLSYKLIDLPINNILNNNPEAIRNIGASASLIHHDLIEKIRAADETIYSQNMSLSLKCGKYSKFAFLNEVVATNDLNDSNKINSDNKFESYNNLKAIYNFAKDNPDIFNNLLPDLLKPLRDETSNVTNKINYSLKYFTSKYIKSTTIEKILKLYKAEIDKLF
ncbi:MAG: glycosyltransferase [Rickettsiaceae bacterium]|nr:glycosyltransferase [Rickettsiaceae bacterium]